MKTKLVFVIFVSFAIFVAAAVGPSRYWLWRFAALGSPVGGGA